MIDRNIPLFSITGIVVKIEYINDVTLLIIDSGDNNLVCFKTNKNVIRSILLNSFINVIFTVKSEIIGTVINTVLIALSTNKITSYNVNNETDKTIKGMKGAKLIKEIKENYKKIIANNDIEIKDFAFSPVKIHTFSIERKNLEHTEKEYDDSKFKVINEVKFGKDDVKKDIDLPF